MIPLQYSVLLYFWLYAANIVGFALMGLDKYRAVYAKRRIPEWLLMVVAALFGAFGSLCGMIIFKHKTSKKLFYIGVPLLLLLQILGLAFYFTPQS